MVSDVPRVRCRKTPRIALLFAAVVLAAAFMGAARAALPPPVAQALAAAGIPESSVGLYVHEVGADRPLIAHGAERALNPASTMKLVTTYAALELLGPAYAWNTEVYAAGPVQNEVLAGDLIIKGYGDPKLTLENFWLLLRGVKARGVRELRGDLVLDRTYFAAEEFDPARFDDQPLRPYNTGPDALLVNFKALTVQFVPDAETRTVRLIAEPAMPALQVVNNLALSDAPCGDWASRLKLEFRATATRRGSPSAAAMRATAESAPAASACWGTARTWPRSLLSFGKSWAAASPGRCGTAPCLPERGSSLAAAHPRSPKSCATSTNTVTT